MTSEPIRRYLPDDAPPPEPTAPPTAPRPGHGRVWINSVHGRRWVASWQDGDRIEDFPGGTCDQAIAWARTLPAADRVIFSAERDDYVDLAEWLAGRAGDAYPGSAAGT